MRIVALLVLVAALSGCFGGPGQLSEEEARGVAQDAMRSFATSFASEDGGDLRLISGDFEMDDEDFGSGTVEFEVEWGKSNTGRIMANVDAGGGGFSIQVQFEVYCGADRTVIVYGDESLEQRHTRQACLEHLSDAEGTLSAEDFDELNMTDVTPNDDGTVTAHFEDEEGSYTVFIDAKGRIRTMDFTSEAGSGIIKIDYGERRVIVAPEADQRAPTTNTGWGWFMDGQYEWSALETGDAVPMGEIQIRVNDPDGQRVATFTAGQDATDNGFVFDYTDDGDGFFGPNDTYVIRSDAWTSSGQYDVVMWDTWADREVGDLGAPGPAFALLAIALLALVAMRRR